MIYCIAENIFIIIIKSDQRTSVAILINIIQIYMNTAIRVTLSTAVATALVFVGLANISYDKPTRGTVLQ